MKVSVIMSNDYPDCVFADPVKAEDYVKEKMAAQDCNCGLTRHAPREKHAVTCPCRERGITIYYRAYEFEVKE